jgi:copper resistance protein B
MRTRLLAAALAAFATPASAQQVEMPAGEASPADHAEQMREMAVMAHDTSTFHMLLGEIDYAREQGRDLVTWDAEGWVGGDVDKLWLKSEGEHFGGETETAEVQALYSRNVATFFDAQVGVRYDIEPKGTAYLVAGVQGLAPYLLETDVAAFLSEHGDVSLRAKQSFDLLLTQRTVLEPHVEANLYLQDVPELGVGSGLSNIEAGLQLRYEITRRFAPYLDLEYDRALGDTRRFRLAAGEEAGRWVLKAGLRLWF